MPVCTGHTCHVACDHRKKMLSDMVTFVPNNDYKFCTDASNFSIGACLVQYVYYKGKEKKIESISISYHTNQSWSPIEMVYTIYYSLQKLHHSSVIFTSYTSYCNTCGTHQCRIGKFGCGL